GTGLALIGNPSMGAFTPSSAAIDNRDRIVLAGQLETRLLQVTDAEMVTRLQSDSAAVEFYNASLDHYFMTWMPREIAKLDAGTEIKGWVRTGYSFKVYTTQQATSVPVCRYYIPPELGDSHFFGRDVTECAATG